MKPVQVQVQRPPDRAHHAELDDNYSSLIPAVYSWRPHCSCLTFMNAGPTVALAPMH